MMNRFNEKIRLTVTHHDSTSAALTGAFGASAGKPMDAVAVDPLLHGPILRTLIRLAIPTVIVLLLTTFLGFAETYFVSTLGVHAIAAASLVVPVMMLMTMVSNGGIGGGVSSSIARARGAKRLADAESLVWHAVIIGAACGVLFMAVVILGGPFLYRHLGGEGDTLRQARVYSDILFAGAIFSWELTMLQAALGGAGNVKMAALIMFGGVCVGLIFSPALIMGWLGLPKFGIAGAGIAQVACNVGSLAFLVSYMRSPRSNLRLRVYPLKREHFLAILGVGLPSSLSALMTTGSITALTAAAGVAGTVGIAGYGIAARLELMLVPVMFGFGTAVITMVGTNLGAGNVERARRVALTNAFFVAALIEAVGIAVAVWPSGWVHIFSEDNAVVAIGGHYLRVVGPVFGLIAIMTSLYFAGQGAGKILWPLIGGATRLIFALSASVAVLSFGISIITAFSIVCAGAVAAGLIALYGFYVVKWEQR